MNEELKELLSKKKTPRDLINIELKNCEFRLKCFEKGGEIINGEVKQEQINNEKFKIEAYKSILEDLEMSEFIKTHYVMNGFNELIPVYDEVYKFNELEEWLENEK